METRHVLFLQGGGGDEDYAADAPLAASLQEALGEAYVVRYPRLPVKPGLDLGRKQQIEQALSLCTEEQVVVAHSLGASMLLKYLTEEPFYHPLAGIFLLATPFWQGNEAWKQELKLSINFADKLPKNLPIFLYHCRDDEVVSFEHLGRYARQLPQATVRPLPSGGHHLNQDLSLVAKDIIALR